jgi:hypothetical protein
MVNVIQSTYQSLTHLIWLHSVLVRQWSGLDLEVAKYLLPEGGELPVNLPGSAENITNDPPLFHSSHT